MQTYGKTKSLDRGSSFGTSASLHLSDQCAARSYAPCVVVNLVQLNVAVTDNKGNYVTDLQPLDFAITEDGIPENIATFEDGNGPTTRLVDVTAGVGKDGPDEPASAQGHSRIRDSVSGSSVEDPPETLRSEERRVGKE